MPPKIFIIILILLTSSCFYERPVIKPHEITKDIIPKWQKRNEVLQNLKAQAKILISTPEGSKRFNALYLASLPLNFRVEVLTPFGQTIAGISSDGENIYALNVNDNLCFKSPLKEGTLAKFIPFRILPDALVDLLITRIPFLDNHDVIINSLEKGLLEVSVKGKEEEIVFDGKDELIVRGELGDLEFSFEKFFKSGEILIPSKIILRNNSGSLIFLLENPVINSKIEPQDFLFTFPEDCLFTEEGVFQ